MKFVRLLLIWLGVLVALAAVLVAVLFTSPLQTWLAQSLLDRQPGWKSSIGEVSAGLGQVRLTDLHVEAGGAILTLPSLQVRLPLAKAVREHSVVVHSLVAKGWTLDLSGMGESPAEETPAVPAPAGSTPAETPASTQAQAADTAVKKVEEIFRGILGGWKSPYDLEVDGVDLEGDVIVPVSPESAPVKIHVLLQGGGLSGGHEGVFMVEADATAPSQGLNAVAAHGRIRMSMSSPRTLHHVAIKADLSAQGRWWPDGFAASVDLAASHEAGETAVNFDLVRDGRHLVTVQARISMPDQRVTGDWKVDLHDTDLAPFASPTALPALSGVGTGHFESDAAFSQVRVLGHLDAAAHHLEVLAPWLARVGPVSFSTQFDVTRRGRTLRVEALEVSLAGNHPVANARALRALDFSLDTNGLRFDAPASEWIQVTIHGLPLDWLSALTGKFAITGGDATGEFSVGGTKDRWGLGMKSPLQVMGLEVAYAGRPLVRGLNLSLPLIGEFGPDGWRMRADPVTLSTPGHRLTTLTIEAKRPSSGDRALTLTGNWNADLDGLTPQPALPKFPGQVPRQASGDFTAVLGNGAEVDGKLEVRGHDRTHSLTATLHAESGGENSAVEFKVPLTITLGKKVSAFSAEGSWRSVGNGVRLNGRLTGEDIDLDHLRLLVAPLATAAGLPQSMTGAVGARGPTGPLAAPDRKPFWTGWSGEVTVAFDRLRSGSRDFPHVGATFDFDEASITVNRAWFGSFADNPTQAEASLSFDGAAEFPYRLKATVTVNDIDVAPLLGVASKKEEPHQDYKFRDDHAPEPVLEGHFSLAATLTGNGRNPDELLRRTQEEFHVTGKGGIIRLLKTNVGDALPDEPPTPVSDAAGTVGSWVGWLAGVKKDSLVSPEKPVSRNTEAVLNLTSQIAEIGYDQISVTAIRGENDVIRLVAIEMTARDERLTGSGQIAAGSGLPLAARPLAMDLKLGVRGNVAALLTQAGLLTGQNDELGYLQLVRSAPLHFGGTLQHPDASDWHDLLAKAAMPPPQAKPTRK